MTADRRFWLEQAREVVAGLRDTPLLRLRSGYALGHAEGFIPRLVAWTHEDKAAKGLRSLKDRQAAAEPPIHFSALEMMQDTRFLLLTAPPGGGKTAFAHHLVLCLAGELAADPVFGVRLLATMPSRNDFGDVRADGWLAGPAFPAVVRMDAGGRFDDMVSAAGDGFRAAVAAADADDAPVPLLIVDDAHRAGAAWPRLCADALALLARVPRLRIVLLANPDDGCRLIPQPSVTRHALLPFTVAQRRAFEAAVLVPRGLALPPGALSDAAANPALFALAQASGGATAEEIVDTWMAAETGAGRQPMGGGPVADLVAARRLADRPRDAVALFRDRPAATAATLASLVRRLSADPARLADLVDGLLALEGEAAHRGALIAATAVDTLPDRAPRIVAALLRLVEAGALPIAERAEVGRRLSVLGDPRALEALVPVAGGYVVIGSATHPNSSPVHCLWLTPYLIGAYPVTNGLYRRFVMETERNWVSSDGLRPERANAPAVDLTWHDARAYCAWLTARWRMSGGIAPHQVVRLPTEPEWEMAARGAMPDAGANIVHPWGDAWDDDRCNAEDAGLNDTCAVGLFPRGVSPHGCFDMAGQVWEWCSTLWGEDMAAPTFAYPWRDDGRDDATAPDRVRRVLRGGCFSSVPEKASATYRGSLEANGFWRGNGFRIVVADAPS